MTIAYTVILSGLEYGFDFEDERIDIDANIDQLDATNLWTAIKEAQASSVGISYPVIAEAEGVKKLSTGIYTYLTVELQHNWEINSLKVSGKFEVIGGNVIRADESDPFRDNPLITYINYISQAGVIATVSTGSGLSTEEHNQLMSLLTELRFINLSFNRSANVSGSGISKRVSSYSAGTVDGGGKVDVAVTYDSEDSYALAVEEAIQ